MLKEIRTAPLFVETRSATGRQKLIGYAAVFNAKTNIGGIFVEQIAPGAFAASVARDDVRALYNHNENALLGRTTSGSLRLLEDAHGLRCELDVPDTTLGRDTAALIDRGDLSGMSFGFHVLDEDWSDSVDPPLRTLKLIDLSEVSICPRPQYTQTSIAVRLGAYSALAAAARLRMWQGFRNRGIAA